MVDIHSHIIPGIDDGSNSIETTLEMLSIAKERGITKMVASSHYYRGKFENSISLIEEKTNELNEILKEKAVGIDIIPGQEVFIDNYTLDAYKEGKIGCIKDTNYMLVEFDMMHLNENVIDILYELKIKGVKPIIAHPERYIYIQKDIYKINEFIEENTYFQINAGSIEGLWGKIVQNTAISLIEEGVATFISSDAHSIGKRAPGYNKALKEITKIDYRLGEKFVRNANLLIKNENIESKARKLKKTKGIFAFFK